MKRFLMFVCVMFIVCSATGCSKPEDEILGTWKYEKEYEISDVGEFYNKSVYTFEKENGKYIGAFFVESSITSSPASYDFTFKIVDSTIKITSVETGKAKTLDFTINEDTLMIGDLEYIKVEE